MLARANRLLSADDFKVALRKGRRRAGRFLVISVHLSDEDGPEARPRFGFILSRKVGNAVQRNRIRRQLRAASAQLLGELSGPVRIVVRVLPGTVGAGWQELRGELRLLLSQAGAV